MNSFRTERGGRIDRSAPVSFSFNGSSYRGYRGDTLASALLANGVHFVGRSFKYHRPRGIFAAGVEEPNALVHIDRGQGRDEPNTRATVAELYEGMCSSSQNHWPTLRYDIGALNDRLGRLFGAGFYYKTFMWPKTFWTKVYEPVIRAAAGLGKAPARPDPDLYASRYEHCDVLVVGAGAAGLAAALAAGRSGANVMLVDEQSEAGGSLLAEQTARISGKPTAQWLVQCISELANMPNVRILTRTTAFGYYHDNMLGLCQRVTDHLDHLPVDTPRERLWRVRAKQVVLCQGAIERPLVFPGNDRPGVMLAGAARTYLNRYGVKVGRRVVVATANDAAWETAFELADADVRVAAILDCRAAVDPSLRGRAEKLGIEALTGWTICDTSGKTRIKAVVATPPSQGGRRAKARTIACDTLLTSAGWTPSIHLFSQARGKAAWDRETGVFVPESTYEKLAWAGACGGMQGLQAGLSSGDLAGRNAASAVGFTSHPPVTVLHVDADTSMEGSWSEESPDGYQASKAFVDLQNDVTSKDIRLAVREGFLSIEHIKRYTTNGMATDQGKTSNINGLVLAAGALKRSPPEIGLTTFRPPYTPTTFATFVGYKQRRHFNAVRKTPMDDAAVEAGAVFEPVSLWRRAWYFPRGGEHRHDAVRRECRGVRESVGMFDASTLGKIEVCGPDAAEFLNRMYVNDWTKLAPGRCRYGLMLGEDGYMRDDGVVGRLAADRFHVTTTTGGASRVFRSMEDYRQTEWPDLKVWLTSTTEQWAVIAVSGPQARAVLEPLVEGVDMSRAAFPHMSVAEGTICGVPLRLFRVSFTGELGFEVNVPARHGLSVWRAIADAGKVLGIQPYGTEANHVLRAEKGYIIVGQDADGTVTPDDVGYGRLIAASKPDFVGKRGLMRPDLQAAGRRQLVGLLTDDPKTVLEEGAQIVSEPPQSLPAPMIGHVTSSYYSDAMGRSIALALVENGRALMGREVFISMPSVCHRVRITGSVFLDPNNERLNV